MGTSRWSTQLGAAVDPDYRTVVALDGMGAVVGFATLGPARDADLGALGCCEVLAFYAVPEVWGRGERPLADTIERRQSRARGMTLAAGVGEIGQRRLKRR